MKKIIRILEILQAVSNHAVDHRGLNQLIELTQSFAFTYLKYRYRNLHYTLMGEDVTLNEMAIDELLKIIDSISPISKVVFNMFAIDGFSHKEIAEKLNISVGTSKWHLASARKQIQSKLKLAYPQVQFYYG